MANRAFRLRVPKALFDAEEHIALNLKELSLAVQDEGQRRAEQLRL